MNAPIKTIETPFGKHKVEMKEWITGADREYIDGAAYSSIEATPHISGKNMSMNVGKLNVEKMTNSAMRRAIEKFIVSVDGKKEKVVEEVMDMHEDDTAFVMAAIDESSKKKAQTGSI